MTQYLFRLAGVILLLASVSMVGAQEATPSPLGTTLNSILARGEVGCGVNGDLRGFGFLDPNTGEVRGFDVDFCRALGAAVFGDGGAVRLIPYTGAAGLEALTSGEIDVLLQNVTWTFGQDSGGLTFGTVTFYNGQSFMVRAESGLEDWGDLDGKTICVTAGSPAETSLGLALASRGLTAQVLTLDTQEEAQLALLEGRCDAQSADRVTLEILRQQFADSGAFVVWQRAEQLYTQEPYAPLYRDDDPQWADIVNWTLLGLIKAEEMGITSENVGILARKLEESDDAYVSRVGIEIARFLDVGLGGGEGLGVSRDFMALVIGQVGNYGEIYNRHLGPESGTLRLERGLNRLWTDGGLLYSPDWR